MAESASDRFVVLLSGGLDSTVAATLVRREGAQGLALTVDYGQRAARQEAAAAYAVATALGLDWQRVALPWLGRLGSNALTDSTQPLPEPETGELDTEAAHASADRVWVPNRNGVLLNVAAAYAEARGAARVVMGFNREEAATFPDNSQPFLEAANRALALSTRGAVRLLSPTLPHDKTELVRLGAEHDAPLGHVWVCYRDEDAHCGRCESCRRFERALERSGLRTWWQQRRRAARPNEPAPRTPA